MHTWHSYKYTTKIIELGNSDEMAHGMEANVLKESLKALMVRGVESVSEKAPSAVYGDVTVVKVSGIRCVAKKVDVASILREQLSPEEKSLAAKSYSEMCARTRELQHPNLVHFMGALSAGPGAPLLVAEHLQMNLTSFIGEYPRIPTHLKCSILLGVALGLRYLHDQTPPIVHGCLSADCILLSDTLRTKLTGHLALDCYVTRQSEYLPPEITSKNEKLTDPQSDVFAFGNLLMHLSLQRKPSLLLSKKQRPNPNCPDEVVSLSEVQRREVFLREMGEGMWTYDLATECLNDEPASRPSMTDIVATLEKISQDNPPPYSSFTELLSAADQLSEANESIISLNAVIEAKQDEIGASQDQHEAITQSLAAKDIELEAIRMELKAQKQALEGKNKMLHAHEQGLRAKDALIKAKDRELAAKKKEIVAKEMMLRAANKRAKILEQNLTQKRMAVSSPRDTSSASFLKVIPEPETATVADAEDVVVRRSMRGRSQRSQPVVSDGLVYQNWQIQGKGQDDRSRQIDPKLASIFARRQQHIVASEEYAKKKQEELDGSVKEKRVPPEVAVRRRSQSMGGREPMPELQKQLESRRSETDIDPGTAQ